MARTPTNPIGLSLVDRFTDQLAVAAEAVKLGSTRTTHWKTLAAFVRRDGIDHVANALARLSDRDRPTRAWWHCTLLLSTGLSPDDAEQVTRMLIEIEDAGGGPPFDLERHALQVSATLRYLEAHLTRVHAGAATMDEQHAAALVVRAMRVATLGRG